MRLPRAHKIGLGLISVVVSIVIVFQAFSVQPAQATFPTFDAGAFGQWIKSFLEKNQEKAWKTAASKALEAAARRYLARLAYETANFLATGGPGQTSLNRREGIGRILRNTSEAALGDFLQDLSAQPIGNSNLNALGLNICNPTAQLKLGLSLELLDAAEPPAQTPCNIREIQDNWKRLADSADATLTITEGQGNFEIPWQQVAGGLSAKERVDLFNDLFSPRQSSLGIYNAIKAKQQEEERKKEVAIQLKIQSCEAQEDLMASIAQGEYVRRNCQEIVRLEEQAGESSGSAQDTVEQQTSKGETGLFLNAAKIFGNTLISGLLKKYIQAGSFSLREVAESPNLSELRTGIVEQLRSGSLTPLGILSGKEVANSLAQLQRPTLTNISDFDYLTDMTICPSNRNQVELDNCTIDDDFAAAIRDKLTVGEAIETGQLRSDLPLISNLNAALNSDPFCIRNGYCHSNIVRLRKYRVVPIGWEIAASLSPLDNPVTLGEIVNCFDNGPQCRFDAASNVFYRLVDPNWVLKAPETECKAEGFGPRLIDIDLNERQTYCSDPISCLSEDDNGNCVGGFGYCTQEKNIWRFNGEQCPGQYASCTLYTKTIDSRQFSYIESSVELCGSNEAGCLWYSRNQDNIGSVTAPVLVWNENDRIYFNREVEECPAESAGCNEYISVVTPGVNLVPNGDFDYFTGNPSTNYADPNWLDDGAADSFSGWQSTSPTDVFTSRSNSYYGTIGAHIENGQFSTNVITGILADRTYTLSWFGKSTGANTATCDAQVSISSISIPAQVSQVTYRPDWQQYQLTTTFGVNNLDTNLTISFSSPCSDGAGTDGIFIDGVKFELNDSATGFSDYGTNGFVYLNSGAQCVKDDVGCDLFTPVRGGYDVPGKIDSNDICPAECVGYQNYLESTNIFDELEATPLLPATPRSVNFIAETADQCPANESGCEEFTNLEEVAQGGEGRLFISDIRQCVEDALGITYYTLEGSDTAGYQVRTWRLLESDIVDPVTGIGNAPCTNVDIGGTTCTDSTNSPATCTAADLNSNLDCREFFDLDGNPHYVLQSRAIFASDECTALRRSETGSVFFGLPLESRQCSAISIGCSEYRGNQGNNIRTLASDDFESGNFDPWDSTSVTLSSESVTTGGASITNLVGTIERPITQPIGAGKSYYLSFWAKNTIATTIGPRILISGTTYDFTPINIPVPRDWQAYNVGPLPIDLPSAQVGSLLISLTNTGATYLDNIVLKETTTNVYRIKDSWNTPASCDQPIQGAMLGCQTYSSSFGDRYNLRSFSRLCQEEVLGCQAFIDTQNSSNPFQEIWLSGDDAEIIVPQDSIDYIVYDEDNTCFSQDKGCSLVGKPTINRSVPEGDPNYIEKFVSLSLIDDPDEYGSILCSADALFCEEYSDSKGELSYFRDPGTRLCIYDTNVNVFGELFSGWFRKETMGSGQAPVGCSDDGVLPIEQSDFRLIDRISASSYDGYVGECPSQYDLCTEFKDPLDTQGDNLLINPEFATELLGVPTGWSKSAAPTTLPVTTNTSLGYSVVTIDPYGTNSLLQTIPNIEDSGIFSMSAEVNIRSLIANPDQRVQLQFTCQWDSQVDTDYCTGPGPGLMDFSSPCNVDADCSVGETCVDFTWTYCKDSGGNWTNEPCNALGDNTHCVNQIGAGATCANAAVYDPNSGRDHVKNYFATADPDNLGQWQTLQTVIDVGTDGNNKELVQCYVALATTVRVQDLSNYNQTDGVVCSSDPSPGNFECYNTYCINPAGDSIAGTNDDTVSSTLCSLSNNPGNASVLANGDCSSVGAGFQCGGLSEVWWRNPVFKEAKGYYYINDDLVSGAECNGQIGKKDGCLLFIDMSQRQTKLYDTFASYDKSSANADALVSPVACTPGDPNCTADSNRIIKVIRDRECSEWLACRSSTEVFDPSTNTYRQVCDQVGTCNEYVAGTDVLNCANWVDPIDQRLEYGYYISRPIDFDSSDFTGYSMYDHYQVGTMELVDVSVNSTGTGPDGRNPDYRLVRTIDQCDSSANYYLPCGPELTPGNPIGRCFATNKCVVGINGSTFGLESDYVIQPETRIWAEKDSPFPFSVVEQDVGGELEVKFGFEEANICRSRVSSCEQRYLKFQYGGIGGGTTRYYSGDISLSQGAITNCVCQGGSNDGQACYSDVSSFDLDGDGTLSVEERCPNNGSAVFLTKTEAYINWPGYCLEKDARATINGDPFENACLTWLPVDNSPNGFDFFNQNREAGYGEKIPAYYCLEVGLFEYRKRFYLGTNCSGSTCSQGMLPSQLSGQYYVQTVNRGSSCHVIHDIEDCYAVPIGGDGLYSYDGQYCGHTVSRGSNEQYCEGLPDPSCQYIAQTVDERGENAAMTNRFWEGYGGGSGYSIQGGGLGYTLDTDDRPFGSAVPEGIGFIQGHLYVKNPQIVPRAGYPYACSSDASSCQLFDDGSPDQRVRVEGFFAPNWLGNETYVDGVNRLKEIYRKIFYIGRWSNGNSCDRFICGGSTALGDGTFDGPGSYFGGLDCSPSNPNACNSLGTASCRVVNNNCVNSVFNNTSDPNSALFNTCSACPNNFSTKQTPDKQCKSAISFADLASCQGGIVDPTTGWTCADVDAAEPAFNYTCQQEPDMLWYCLGERFSGNDCKIPFDSSGNLIPTYLACGDFDSNGYNSCYYDGYDTGILCASNTDCTNASAGDPNSLQGQLLEINQQSFCADGNLEGPHEILSPGNSYCFGDPFTDGNQWWVDASVGPVNCNPAAQFTNALGYTLGDGVGAGNEICQNIGLCIAEYTVRKSTGELACKQTPTGYLPLCDPDIDPAGCVGLSTGVCSNSPSTSCVGDADCVGGTCLVEQVHPTALPLDDAYDVTTNPEAHPRRGPFIIPTVCDLNGLNCTQAWDTNNHCVPDHPTAPSACAGLPTNSFSVNNKYQSGDVLTGFVNYLATVKFYMSAGKNHMPVRLIDIDWDDDIKQTRVGYYKNHMEECGDTSAIGPITDSASLLEYAADPQACREGFRSYLHVYQWDVDHLCNPIDHPGLPAGVYNIASCYKPKVMIQDNWGWCTNGVFGLTGAGCTDTSILGGATPAPVTVDDAFVEFNGVIVVYKDPQP